MAILYIGQNARMQTTMEKRHEFSINRIINVHIATYRSFPMTSQSYTILRHWFSLIVGLKTLPDKGLTENTKLK